MTLSRALLRELRAIAGPASVRTEPTALQTFATDGLPHRTMRPGAVVLPRTPDEVVEVVRACAAHDTPIVPRGAGTGLSGGALGGEESVVIALTRLNRILEIDPANRRAVVEPGVVNAKLSQAAAPYGLYYAPDPSSQSACTVGGNVAENAGGPHCLKYGVTTQHVLALEVVLPNGDQASFGSPAGEPWGPDLVSLFVGSEGMFGIALRITVRLIPTPGSVRTLLADYASVRDAASAVSKIIAAGLVPAALELLDRRCIEAVEASVYAAGYPRDAAAVLLVEVDGAHEVVVRAEAERCEAELRAAGARSIRAASTEAERARLWQGRKKAFGAMGRVNRDLFVQDAVVPRSELPSILEYIDAVAAQYAIPVANVFHAGDGNLHPTIGFDARDVEFTDRVERASAAIMERCIAAGGTITGEHGVGLDKVRYMPAVFEPNTLEAMCAVRRVFDPSQRCNPGKVFPVHSCQEWRGWAPAAR